MSLHALISRIACVTLVLWPIASIAQGCGLRLLLALDSSASLSDYEYNLQRVGLSRAFQDPAIIRAISSIDGGIRVAVTQWAGPGQQELSIGWTEVRTAAQSLALAGRLAGLETGFKRGATAIGDALRHAGAVLELDRTPCARVVIDVSGDGGSNSGVETAPVADALVRQGVTINGLVILVDQKHDPNPLVYYSTHVVRGPGGFIETAQTFNDYPEAIKRKLLREMLPNFALNKLPD